MNTQTVRFAPWVLLCLAMAGMPATSAPAVDFPGPDPGPAKASQDRGALVLENNVLACRWNVAGARLKPDRIVDRLSGKTLALAGPECFRLAVMRSPSPVARAVKSSDLALAGDPKVTEVRPDRGSRRSADQTAGRQIEAHFVSPDGNLEVAWSAVLRDGANYVRQHLVVRANREPAELRDVTLVDLAAPGAAVAGSVDGSPVVAGNLFFGCEHPLSRSEVLPSDAGGMAGLTRIRCGYPYNLVVVPGKPLEQTAVVGVVPAGQLRRGFLYYLEQERAQPYHTFLHHSCGYQVGCEFWRRRRYGKPEEFDAFVPRQEPLWLELIDTFGRELVEKRGVVLDSFVHDHGWDDVSLVWQFHQGYANGFAPEQQAAEKYGSAVGVWFSPWGGYSGRALRVEAGGRQGFETNKNGLSLAGPRYYARFREACVGMVRDYGVNFFKFDGVGAGNSQPSAGAFAGDVEALLRLCEELRRLKPDVFLNPTSGTWPSPFWLLWADSIWRQESDAGFLGKGTDRQQWLTYRDNATFHGTLQRGPLYPISSLMLHGIMIHKYAFKNPYDPENPAVSCRPDDILDEIRSYFATGTCLQELHIDPSLMTAASWDALAEAARWSRANADVLADTHWIGGDPATGAIYGWASWSAGKGILALRNPSDQRQQIALDIGRAFELPAGAPTSYRLTIPWKDACAEPSIRVSAGRPHVFELQPFELLVFDADPSESAQSRE